MKLDLKNIDRRIIYLLVLLALALPLINHYSIPPARMKSAEKLYSIVQNLSLNPGEIVLVVMDFGPNSKAENVPQSEVVVEHLMRRRIPFAVYSQYVQASPFLDNIPEKIAARLSKEDPSQVWTYGVDWVNLGYRPGGFNTIKSIAASDNLVTLLKRDTKGNQLSELPAFKNVRTLEQVKLLVQLTSLVGTLDTLLQFLKRKDYRPDFAHGCTSITIPQAFIYLDSGQLRGLLEGIAGAAWYSALLKKEFPARETDLSLIINTGLGVAHLVIILLVVLGNVMMFFSGGRS